MKIQSPNFNNRRTRKTIMNAYAFVNAMMGHDTKAPISFEVLLKEFSSCQSVTGKWLRYHLLECVDENYSMYVGTCKKYRKRPEGIQLIEEILDVYREFNAHTGLTRKEFNQKLNLDLSVDWAMKRYPFDQITYKEKSNRYWHGAQNLRKSVRNEYLKRNGLKYQYDLVCAAQTLLYDRFKTTSNKRLHTIESYLIDRDAFRHHLAKELQLPISSIKTILTSMFAGARLSKIGSIYEACQYDKARIEWIKQDPEMIQLKKEITFMWKKLKPQIETEGTRLGPRDKWRYYFKLEKQVMDVIINETNTKHYIIHDCIATEDELDTNQLTNKIFSLTGINIQLEKSVL